MKVKDIVETIYGLMFYPDWKVENKFKLHKNYKVEIYHNNDYINFHEIVLMKKSKMLLGKSYSIDCGRNITLCDNVTHILFSNSDASMCLLVDDDISVTVSRTDMIQAYK
jgi:hypothetical protein